jgi:predicted restriction endonuclease
MKECSICKKDITHKKSNNSSKCEKCSRRLNQNSLNKIKERTKNMVSVKREILLAYNVSCAICGWAIKQQKINGKYLHQKGCEIHHIDSVSSGGKDVFENCILLCPNHHKEADLGLIEKDVLLSYVIKNKEIAMNENKLNHLSIAANLIDDLL